MFHHDIEIQIKTTNKREIKKQISKFKTILESLAKEGAIESYKITQWKEIDDSCREGKTKAKWPKKKVSR